MHTSFTTCESSPGNLTLLKWGSMQMQFAMIVLPTGLDENVPESIPYVNAR